MRKFEFNKGEAQANTSDTKPQYSIPYENGFQLQWEDFIRHVVADTPWHHGLIEGVKGVQLAELGLQSWKERRWLDVPDIKI